MKPSAPHHNNRKENAMPKVGKKEFPYTAKGMAMAKAEAKKRGVPMKNKKKSKKY
jgi:hypothetical protein